MISLSRAYQAWMSSNQACRNRRTTCPKDSPPAEEITAELHDLLFGMPHITVHTKLVVAMDGVIIQQNVAIIFGLSMACDTVILPPVIHIDCAMFHSPALACSQCLTSTT